MSQSQLASLRTAGKLRRFTGGEVLLDPGERDYPFLLLGGRVEVVRFAAPDRPEMVLGRWGPGEFAGEWGLLVGEAAFFATRAVEPGVLHEIPRERLLGVPSEDGEFSR